MVHLAAAAEAEWDNRGVRASGQIFNDDWMRLPDEKLTYCRKRNCPPLSSIAARNPSDSVPPNKMNEADAQAAGSRDLKQAAVCQWLRSADIPLWATSALYLNLFWDI